MSKPIKNLTKQRQAVLEVIHETEGHLTATEVYDKAKSILPTISFATVYNSLRYLKENGYIGEVSFPGGASKFDRWTDRHDHAVCTTCDSLIDLELDLPDKVLKQAKKQSGFEAPRIEVTLRGVCSDCRQKSEI